MNRSRPKLNFAQMTRAPPAQRAVGLDLLAVVRVKATFEKLQACFRMFASMPEILEVYRVTGEDCLVLKVIVAQAQQRESVIDKLAKHGSVTTSIVLSSRPATPISRRILAAASALGDRLADAGISDR